MKSSLASKIYSAILCMSLFSAGAHALNRQGEAGESSPREFQQAVRNAKTYLRSVRAPKPSEVGTPMARLWTIPGGRQQRSPAGWTEPVSGNDRLAVDARPVDPTRSGVRIAAACTTANGGFFPAGSAHYDRCLGAGADYWNATSPSGQPAIRTGRAAVLAF